MVRGIEDVVQQSGLAGALEGIKENAKVVNVRREEGKKEKRTKERRSPSTLADTLALAGICTRRVGGGRPNLKYSLKPENEIQL